jgi:hypothetical protein
MARMQLYVNTTPDVIQILVMGLSFRAMIGGKTESAAVRYFN